MPSRKGNRRRITAIALAVSLTLSSLHSAWSAPTSTYPPLFGTSEIRSTNTSLFRKWIKMLERHFTEEQAGDVPCSDAAARGGNVSAQNAICKIWKWRTFIDFETDHPRRAQLDEVNAHLNQHRYILDIVNYGLKTIGQRRASSR